MEQGKSISNVKGKNQAGKTPVRSNTKVLVDGGLNRSSDEVSVTEMERRVGVIQLELPFTTSVKERRITSNSAKGIPITKRMVWESYQKVRKNKGAGGVDGESLEAYSADLQNNLYKLWNRLASGSYFPSAVKEVEIPKKDGSIRKLGIPTISDRIAQQVMKDYLEDRLERVFHKNSYGYRPKRNAHQAIEQVRQNVRKFNWVIDMDIKGFFDEVSHELLNKAIALHVEESWVKLYINRWLESPVQKRNGELVYREGKGTPQGGVISPLLANLFLHYVLDKWMDKEHRSLKFVRYADDVIVHCRSREESARVLESINARLFRCKLRLHKQKTKIVFCKKDGRAADWKTIRFDFLGYRFQPRTTSMKTGQLFLGFDCAISTSSKKGISKRLRKTEFQRWTGRSIEEIAEYFNPRLQGWLNYFGKFRKWKMNSLFKLFNARLTDWVRNRYKRLKKSYIRACKWLRDYKEINPSLFAHWRYGFINS